MERVQLTSRVVLPCTENRELGDALMSNVVWHQTSEGSNFWAVCYNCLVDQNYVRNAVASKSITSDFISTVERLMDEYSNAKSV